MCFGSWRGQTISVFGSYVKNKMTVSLVEERWNYIKINLWDGLWKFEIDWKAVVGIGIIVLGYAFIKLLAVMA